MLLEQQVGRSKNPFVKDIKCLFKDELTVSSEEALEKRAGGSVADASRSLDITEVTPGLGIPEYLGHVLKIHLQDFE